MFSKGDPTLSIIDHPLPKETQIDDYKWRLLMESGNKFGYYRRVLVEYKTDVCNQLAVATVNIHAF